MADIPAIPADPMSLSEPGEIRAAGAVVRRKGSVLVVHRPAYDDWSFPKGKTDRGEHPISAAVREVEEETSLRIRLGSALPSQGYHAKKGPKRVDYWQGQVRGSADIGNFKPNREIDCVQWMPYREALDQLSYEWDAEQLEHSLTLPPKTRPLIIVRHCAARKRGGWRKKPDRQRPLLAIGKQDAVRLTPLLAAYGVRDLVSSDSTRCTQTLQPYARRHKRTLQLEAGLSEERATRKGVRRIVQAALSAKPSTAICTHRPVLPWIFETLGLEAVDLKPGEFVVVHRTRGQVVAVERHRARITR